MVGHDSDDDGGDAPAPALAVVTAPAAALALALSPALAPAHALAPDTLQIGEDDSRGSPGKSFCY